LANKPIDISSPAIHLTPPESDELQFYGNASKNQQSCAVPPANTPIVAFWNRVQPSQVKVFGGGASV